MKKKIGQYAACFLAFNLVMEPLAGISLFRPNAIMAQEQEVTTESEEAYLLSSSKEVTASSVNGDGLASKATDGNAQSRWESSWGLGDQGTSQIQEWIQIDLGRQADITRVYLNWENACASKYQIQVSDDGKSWQVIKDVIDGHPGEINFDFTNVKARYIRVYCSEKAMVAYGVSLYEFQVFGFNGLYKVNLAQNKNAAASSLLDEWWMKDENGNIKPTETPDAKNAVDGNSATRWRSSSDSAGFQKDTGQWLSVDLEKTYKIGHVNIVWDGEAAASVYDLQVSNDGINWETVYRNLQGDNRVQKIDLSAIARYVRLFCRSKYRDGYVAVKELEVFRQMEDENDVVNEVPDLPEREVITVPDSKATYNSNDIYFANQARNPEYIEDNLKNKPLASNDWWQSLVIKDMGNALTVLPLKVKYETDKGLGMLTFGKSVWNKADDYTQGGVTGTKSESKMAFYVKPSDYDDTNVYNKVSGYGDYHVSANLYDANGLVMANTFVKGSPYTYFEFNQKNEIEINLNTDVEGSYFTESGAVLTKLNDKITSDHLGLKTVDGDKVNYYCFNLPADSEFKRTADGIKITIKGQQTYMSVATMSKASQLDKFYQHGYAFVTDSEVTYDFDEKTSKITSNYNLKTELKRSGFTEQTYQCLLPHQWDKYASTQDLNKLNISYDSPRGSLRLYDGNRFAMTDTFYGMVPQFTMPANEEYDEAEILAYLKKLDDGTQGNLVGSDAYWQGKSLHPLGLGVLVADQIGNTEYRDSFLAKLKTILTDWFTYSGDNDQAFFFYDKNWGTLYYKDSEFGANRDISDHHFTYGYVVFACSVLATYDEQFYQDYQEMIDLLVRDYASPYGNDEMFCKFRSFDPYEGHSWAGGYADNDDGNNQEAGSESLFGWVGAYLWSIKHEDKVIRDTAIYGFTTELNAIEHYWFNYYKDVNDGFDHSGWPEDWPSEIIGQTYGSSYFYGTFFGGYPTYVYGIHWCPVAEYISYYGMDPDKAAKLYSGVEKDTQGQKEAHPEVNDYPDTTNSWQHIFYPFLSLSDVDQAMQNLKNDQKHSQNEGFNTYWFLNNMKDLGKRSSDIYATGGVSSSVYEKEVDGKKEYTAMVWNPTNHEINVDFINNKGEKVGNATISANSFLRLDPTQKDAVQVQKPEFSIESDTYDDTQYVKISCDTLGAKIHYTLDGTVPNETSPVYEGRIVVSDSTTIKAIAIKDGYIDATMNSIKVNLETNCITTGINLATNKNVVASSQTANVAGNITDHNAKTRWEASAKDDQWIYVDLGQEYNINKVKLSWETAFAKGYEIQVTNDPSNEANWQTVSQENNGDGKFDELVFDPVKGRYVRVKCNEPGSDYTYSIYEIGVYEARQISKPQLSLKSGTYDGNQFLAIASGTKGVAFRYTLDGSEPTEKSTLYIPGLTLFEDTKIKVKAFKKGMIPSNTVSGDYIIINGSNPGDVDNYDKAPNFTVVTDGVIDEELLAGEGDAVDVNELVEGNLAYHKNVVVSSSENNDTKGNLVDGKLDSTWSSNFNDVANADEQWCYVDLGSNVDFNQVKIHWVENTTPGNKYAIQVSDDGETWHTVYLYSQSTNNGDDATDICNFDLINARYVKMQGIKRGQGWGYAIREIEVRNVDEVQPFGQNVAINAIVDSNIADIDYIHDGKMETSAMVEQKQSYQLDLAKTYQIDRIVINHEAVVSGSYTVKYSVDGTNWQELKQISASTGVDELVFAPTDIKYLKVEYDLTAPAKIQEIQVYTVGSSSDAPEDKTEYQAVGAMASSETGDRAINVIDNNPGTRWQANGNDTNEWIYIDLGEDKPINQVYLSWETAHAKEYEIQVSSDGVNWQKVYATTNGQGGQETIDFAPVAAQYVKMQCLKRGTDWASSLYEMKASYLAPIALDHILVGPAVNKVVLKDKLQLQYAFYPANASDRNITFTSSDESVASVDQNGLVTAKKLGHVTIRAKCGDKTSAVEVYVTGKLAKPASLKAINNDGIIELSWNAVELANYYDVYVANERNDDYTKLNETPIIEPNYTISDLAAGKYYFKVIARSSDDQYDYLDSDLSTASNKIEIAKIIPEIELKNNNGTVALGQTLTIPVTIKPDLSEVKWHSSDANIATVANGIITARAPGKAVITISVGDVSAQYYVTVTTKLTTPVLEGSVINQDVNLTWNSIVGANSYEIYRQKNDGEFISVATSNESSFTDNQLAAGTYTYKIIARGDNDTYFASDESNEIQLIVKQQLAPVTLVAKSNDNEIDLSWYHVENAVGYEIYRQIETGVFELIETVDAKGLANNYPLTYHDEKLAAGTYRYKVIAKGDEMYLDSQFSKVVTVQITKPAIDHTSPSPMPEQNVDKNSNGANDVQTGKPSVFTGDDWDAKEIWAMGLSLITMGYLSFKKRFKKEQ